MSVEDHDMRNGLDRRLTESADDKTKSTDGQAKDIIASDEQAAGALDSGFAHSAPEWREFYAAIRDAVRGMRSDNS
jgi:predicted ribonuclease toxin of YeeF-YezG toxin-antitoxin module